MHRVNRILIGMMDMDYIRTMFGELSSCGRAGNHFRQIEDLYAGQNPPAFGDRHGIAFRDLDKFYDWNSCQIATLLMSCPFRPVSNNRDTGGALGKLIFQVRRAMLGGFSRDQLPLVGATKVFQDYFP